MIQRIQTLFLICTIIAQWIFISVPLSSFILEDNQYIEFLSKGFRDKSNPEIIMAKTSALNILAWSIIIIGAITIFLYKKRVLQMRFCVYNILLNIGLIGMLILLINTFIKNNSVTATTHGFALVIPVVNIVLLILAFRGIRKDELLVKAYDRLR